MPHATQDDELAHAWLAALARPELARELERVWSATAAAIEERGPACWASGRCCNFARSGHRLYVTGLEAAYTISRLPGHWSRAVLTPDEVAEARVAGGCPFQQLNLCGVHPIRPLGCRVYFCDRSAQAWQQELYERQLAEIRALHDRFAVAYRYAEWRDMLELFARAKAQP